MYKPLELEDVPVVVVDNFLPNNYIKNLFSDIEKLKLYFKPSHWYFGEDQKTTSQTGTKSNCTGDDLWLPFADGNQNETIGDSIIYLFNFFNNSGLTDFLKNCKSPDLNCYHKFKYNLVYHLINYKNGGFYNWHQDLTVKGMTWAGYEVEKKTTFTFALTLLKDESLISGGEQLFMKDGKVVSLESKNNRLIIFPSDVYHSVSEITMDENTPWINRRFNIQAWLCHL